jgi:hypothetical protein
MDLAEFRKDSGIVYPPFALTYFEKYFYEYMCRNHINNDIYNKYIPVFWTELQISHYNKDKLQNIMKNWDIHNKYFTIVQHDDGINVQLHNNITIYGLGGNGNVPLPLTYDNPELFNRYKNNQKTIFCSFIGSITHHCRQIMIDNLKNKDGIVIMTDNWTNQIDKQKQDRFLDITSKSRFTLCPRGYGKTSFRLYEALKLNSIPIYVYDDCFLPYTEIIDWNKMAVIIHINDINNLYDKIKSITDEQINEMLEYYRKYEFLFTYEGMSNYVVSNFKK